MRVKNTGLTPRADQVLAGFRTGLSIPHIARQAHVTQEQAARTIWDYIRFTAMAKYSEDTLNGVPLKCHTGVSSR